MTPDGGFEEFYSRSFRPLLRVLLPLVVDVHAAEEVAQEAFLRAYRDWARVSTYDDPRAWLYRVAMRLAVSRWRRLRSAAAALVRYGPPPPVDGPDGVSVAVFTALRGLPLAQRQVLVMHHMLGVPIPEIAAELAIPVGTVKARLYRGRTALAGLLSDLEVVDGRG
jgi:RNA polymerase sigma-70 factor (ECF subfamily)